jgi:hypothetical protein
MVLTTNKLIDYMRWLVPIFELDPVCGFTQDGGFLRKKPLPARRAPNLYCFGNDAHFLTPKAAFRPYESRRPIKRR